MEVTLFWVLTPCHGGLTDNTASRLSVEWSSRSHYCLQMFCCEMNRIGTVNYWLKFCHDFVKNASSWYSNNALLIQNFNFPFLITRRRLEVVLHLFIYAHTWQNIAVITLLVVRCSAWGPGRWPSNDVTLISTYIGLQSVSLTQPTVFTDEFEDNYRLGDDGHCCQHV